MEYLDTKMREIFKWNRITYRERADDGLDLYNQTGDFMFFINKYTDSFQLAHILSYSDREYNFGFEDGKEHAKDRIRELIGAAKRESKIG